MLGIFDLYTKTELFLLLNEYYRKPPENRRYNNELFLYEQLQKTSINYGCHQLENIDSNEMDLFLANITSSLFYALEKIPCNILTVRWVKNEYIPNCFGITNEQFAKGLIIEDKGFLSTSLYSKHIRENINSDNIDQWSVFLIKIERNTAKGIYIHDNKDEHELLCEPSSVMRIDRIYKKKKYCTVIEVLLANNLRGCGI